MKLLLGKEIADFIKARHARQVTALRARGVVPKLAIIQAKDDPIIDTYVRLKQQYGADIGAAVDLHKIDQADATELLNKLTNDRSIHGIIVQLPLADQSQTDEIINLIPPIKDVDALGAQAKFEPATPMAIMWLLAGYNIDLAGKQILLIGRGRLVGAPLEVMLKASDYQVEVVDRVISDLEDKTLKADIIITATGSPAILYADMLKPGAVVIDAGTASEDGKTVGDLAADVYTRGDLTLTPQKGGVGPLTVCALFENVILAAERYGD